MCTGRTGGATSPPERSPAPTCRMIGSRGVRGRWCGSQRPLARDAAQRLRVQPPLRCRRFRRPRHQATTWRASQRSSDRPCGRTVTFPSSTSSPSLTSMPSSLGRRARSDRATHSGRGLVRRPCQTSARRGTGTPLTPAASPGSRRTPATIEEQSTEGETLRVLVTGGAGYIGSPHSGRPAGSEATRSSSSTVSRTVRRGLSSGSNRSPGRAPRVLRPRPARRCRGR